MKYTVVSYSLSEDPETLAEWKINLKNDLKLFISEGSEVILYPEFFLMGVSRYFEWSTPQEELSKVSSFVFSELLPELSEILNGKDILLVLGSSPREFGGKFFNSCPVFLQDRWLFQDKLFMTPWEKDLTPGTDLHLFSFRGLTTAVAVCFDSEQPDLAVKLKHEEVHLVLIPAATTDRDGSDRVNRCSSGRAVELGALVLTSPLVGDSKSELIDHNEGRQGMFLPSQADITGPQELFSEYSSRKKIVQHYVVDEKILMKLKERTEETKPYHKAFHPGLNVKRA